MSSFARRSFSPLLCLTLLSALAAQAAATTVSLRSLLDEMIDYDAIARWPDPPYRLSQASSYDRLQRSPDQPGWFANHDCSNFIRAEEHQGRTENVMMDAEGPGAIVRFWLTSPTPTGAVIRIYLDGAEQPSIEWPVYDLTSWRLKLDQPLLSHHVNTNEHGGSTLYLPIPYARHCKVTVEFADPKAADGRYYQINYRTYVPGTDVRTFRLGDVESERGAIDHVNRMLSQPPARAGTLSVTRNVVLRAGETKPVELPQGGMAVRELALSVATELPPALREEALRQVVLAATFDEENDAIWCPVGDFAGSGVEESALESWYRQADGKGNSICRWTMPYQRSAVMTLHNLGDTEVHVEFRANVSPWSWDQRSMYFHATWRRTQDLASDPPRDLRYLHVTGKGALVGDATAVFNPLPSWYGEGDEKIRIDEERFASYLGTGLEDYYNASWAPNPVFQTPFANQPRIDERDSRGNNCYTRTRNLDVVTFERSLDFDFEVQTWKPSRLDWASTVYWYGASGAATDEHPSPAQVTAPLPTPDQHDR